MIKTYSESQWRDVRIKFNRCGRSVWPQQHVLSQQWFQRCLVDFTFWFFYRGEGILRDSTGQTYPLRPGVCLFMGPGNRYEAIQTEGELLGDVFIHADFYLNDKKMPQEEWPEMPFYSEVINVNYFDQVLRTLVELVNHPLGEGASNLERDALEAEMLFKSLLITVLRNHENRVASKNNGISLHHEKKVAAALAMLYEDPLRFKNVSELAQFAGYSASHFRSICHAVTGKKPSDLLIETRIERAKVLLIESDMTIGMIAESLGYENIFYFSRQFHMVTGATASDFRASHR